MASRAVFPSCFSAALVFQDASNVLAAPVLELVLVFVLVANEAGPFTSSLSASDLPAFEEDESHEEKSADLVER